MDFLKRFLKGMVIGVAFIIPGVSGGTLAVILNMYDRMVEAISNLRKEFKKSFAYLLPIALGAVISVLALIVPITLLLKHTPLLLIFLFAGLIIGGIPPLFDKIKGKEAKPSYIATGVTTLLIAVALGVVPVIGNFNTSVNLATINVGGYFLLVLIGGLAAMALVVPGISGSMLLLVLGYYQPILNTAKDLLSSVLHLDFTNFGHNILVLACLAIGILLGFYIISKVMNWLLKKHPVITYFGIVGFVLGSLFSLCFNRDTVGAGIEPGYFATAPWWHYVLGIVLLAVGILCSLYLVKIGRKFAEKEASGEIAATKEAE